MRCHRCLEPMTLYVVGDDYCRKCKAERAERERADAARRIVRFPRPKDLTAA
jgi:hypothetical protein